MKIAFFSTKPFDRQFFDLVNKDFHHQLDYFEGSLNYATAKLCEGYEGVCVFVNDVLDEACIEQLEKTGVKVLALRSAGFNHVNLSACEKANIQVVRVPEYSPFAVAEHAFALLLSLNRKIHKAYSRVREGNFSLNGLMGFDLYGKTVGIVGLGKIGKRFAHIASGFGCQILAYDVAPDETFTETCPLSFVSLETLFKEADIISLHCPLNDKTHHLVNDHSIQQMKECAIIINTGRGGLIDSNALIKGLKNGKISAVGLDVYEQESGVFFCDHSEDIIDDDVLMRLLTFPNVLITSHQGFFTREALLKIAQVTLNNVSLIENQQACDNEVKLYP